ncbi:unnamed protein product, partial [Prorocentrum cordatum]
GCRRPRRRMGDWSADLQSVRIAKLGEVLQQVPSKYQNKDRLRDDVTGLLRSVHTLQPKLQAFEGGGRQVTLFYLFGVLPITYEGNLYHIPVTIYFDPPYPRQPPRCFVTPTDGMELKASHPHVDRGGLIHVQYLSDWNERSSTLGELAEVLQRCFAARPPVHATPSGRRQRGTSQGAGPRRSASQGPAGSQRAGTSSGRQRPSPDACDSQFPLLESLSNSLGVLFVGLAGAMQQVAPPKEEPDAPPLPPPQPPPKSFKLPGAHRHQQASGRPAAEGPPPSFGPSARQGDRGAAGRQASGGGRGLAALVERGSGRAEEGLRRAEAQLHSLAEAALGRELDPDRLAERADPDLVQLLALLAEEQAIEEYLVALDELLAAKRLGLDVFLTEVREAGRRQFLCRVQRQKLAAAIAAPSDGGPRVGAGVAAARSGRPASDDGRDAALGSTPGGAARDDAGVADLYGDSGWPDDAIDQTWQQRARECLTWWGSSLRVRGAIWTALAARFEFERLGLGWRRRRAQGVGRAFPAEIPGDMHDFDPVGRVAIAIYNRRLARLQEWIYADHDDPRFDAAVEANSDQFVELARRGLARREGVARGIEKVFSSKVSGWPRASRAGAGGARGLGAPMAADGAGPTSRRAEWARLSGASQRSGVAREHENAMLMLRMGASADRGICHLASFELLARGFRTWVSDRQKERDHILKQETKSEKGRRRGGKRPKGSDQKWAIAGCPEAKGLTEQPAAVGLDRHGEVSCCPYLEALGLQFDGGGGAAAACTSPHRRLGAALGIHFEGDGAGQGGDASAFGDAEARGRAAWALLGARAADCFSCQGAATRLPSLPDSLVKAVVFDRGASPRRALNALFRRAAARQIAGCAARRARRLRADRIRADEGSRRPRAPRALVLARLAGRVPALPRRAGGGHLAAPRLRGARPPEQVAFELRSGSGRLSAAFRGQGVRALPGADVRRSVRRGVSRRIAQQAAPLWTRSGEVWHVHLGAACAAQSVARSAPDNVERAGRLEAVSVGVGLFAAGVIVVRDRRGILWSPGAPPSSKFFRWGPLVDLASSPDASHVSLDYEGELTQLGMQCAALPVDPQLARMLLESPAHKCTSEALSIAAMLCVGPVFLRPQGAALKDADAARQQFTHLDGDHLSLLNVYHAYKQHLMDGLDTAAFCSASYLCPRALAMAETIRTRLQAVLGQLGARTTATDFNDKEYYPNIRRCIVSGFFMQAAFLEDPKGATYLTVKDCQSALLHPYSTLDKRPECVVYNEFVLTSRSYIRTATRVK